MEAHFKPFDHPHLDGPDLLLLSPPAQPQIFEISRSLALPFLLPSSSSHPSPFPSSSSSSSRRSPFLFVSSSSSRGTLDPQSHTTREKMRGSLWQLGQSLTRRLAQADKKAASRCFFASKADLKKTVLYDFHVENGAKIVPSTSDLLPKLNDISMNYCSKCTNY
ncbi:hypothetical protein Droror1_Dr00011901 [Drosera rotundifolia]